MAHGKEGNGQARSKEDDEVEGQLVPGSERAFQARAKLKHMCMGEITRFGATARQFCNSTNGQIRTLQVPVVDGEGQVVAWCREAITSSPKKRLQCIKHQTNKRSSNVIPDP